MTFGLCCICDSASVGKEAPGYGASLMHALISGTVASTTSEFGVCVLCSCSELVLVLQLTDCLLRVADVIVLPLRGAIYSVAFTIFAVVCRHCASKCLC